MKIKVFPYALAILKKVDAEPLGPPPKFQVNIEIQLNTARVSRLSFRFLWLCSKSDSERESFLNSITLPNPKSKSFDICESEITKKDLTIPLTSMPTAKSPGHYGLTKEFYEHLWDDLKFYFINSLKQSKIDDHLSISQRQAIIKLIAKKDGDKRFVKNLQPISLLKILTQKYFLNHLQKN